MTAVIILLNRFVLATNILRLQSIAPLEIAKVGHFSHEPGRKLNLTYNNY